MNMDVGGMSGMSLSMMKSTMKTRETMKAYREGQTLCRS